jgi:hypothetical protein
MKFLMKATESDLVIQRKQSTTDCTDDSDDLQCRSSPQRVRPAADTNAENAHRGKLAISTLRSRNQWRTTNIKDFETLLPLASLA